MKPVCYICSWERFPIFYFLWVLLARDLSLARTGLTTQPSFPCNVQVCYSQDGGCHLIRTAENCKAALCFHVTPVWQGIQPLRMVSLEGVFVFTPALQYPGLSPHCPVLRSDLHQCILIWQHFAPTLHSLDVNAYPKCRAIKHQSQLCPASVCKLFSAQFLCFLQTVGPGATGFLLDNISLIVLSCPCQVYVGLRREMWYFFFLDLLEVFKVGEADLRM